MKLLSWNLSFTVRWNDVNTPRPSVALSKERVILIKNISTSHTNLRCVTPVVLYTKVDDAQHDKLATVAGRTKLTTPATVDVP